MRSRITNAVALVTALSKLPPKAGRPFGDAAKDLTLEQANRYYSRVERRTWSSDRIIGPAQLNHWAAQRRRAQHTHPGKRGKKGRA